MLIFYVICLESCIWTDVIFAMDPTKKQHQNFVQISVKLSQRPWQWISSVGERKHEPYPEGPNSPRPKKARQVKSKVKNVLIIFFDIKWIFHVEFVLAGQTVNSALLWCYTETAWKCAKTLPQTLALKELAVASWQRTISHFLFHQGIFFTKSNMTVIPHPPYLPDLVRCDFPCFPNCR
jgi:hypothetical protein